MIWFVFYYKLPVNYTKDLEFKIKLKLVLYELNLIKWNNIKIPTMYIDHCFAGSELISPKVGRSLAKSDCSFPTNWFIRTYLMPKCWYILAIVSIEYFCSTSPV